MVGVVVSCVVVHRVSWFGYHSSWSVGVLGYIYILSVYVRAYVFSADTMDRAPEKPDEQPKPSSSAWHDDLLEVLHSISFDVLSTNPINQKYTWQRDHIPRVPSKSRSPRRS